MSDKYITIGGVDMTVNKPCPMQYASCILTRYDNGVSNQQKARTGGAAKESQKGR